MANAWVVCPYNAEYPELMQAIWEDGFKQGYISIGWPKVRDVTGKSREAIQAVIDREYPGRSPRGGSTIWTDGEDFGQQYDTDIGRIDILAYNRIEKAFVVIELKKGRESDAVVGQVARYMTWVRLNLCRDGQTVRGLIICTTSDARLRHAVMAVPGLELRHYQVDFRLLSVEPMKSTND